MLDIKFIRENPEKVHDSAAKKGYKVDIKELLRVDESRRKIQQKIDDVRMRRNEIATLMKSGKPSNELINEGKQIKIELAELEDRYRLVDEQFLKLMYEVPNLIADDVPVGDEKDSVEIRNVGDKKYDAIDHLDFAVERDWVDFERGSKIAGAKFYFLKGDLALLENALYQFALNKVVSSGFKFMTVPHMVNDRILTGTGYTPRTNEQSDDYNITDENLSLIATAEIPITGYHSDEIINESDLPLLYAGYSSCYRREAGASGKHNRGLFRVHQFNKLEMYAFVLPEQSVKIHEKLLEIEENIWKELKIPYRVINVASGDLGAPAYKKYDIEYWSPVDKMYREISSCSNCTDFQARNLNIRVRRDDGSINVVHTLNGTAISLARALVAVLENYQNSNGKLDIPEVLRPYMNGKKEI